MGAYGPIALRGVDHARQLDIGVRLDEVVTAARLKLAFTYSPALVFPLSHIKLTLNDEVIATLPLEEKEAGRLVTRELDIDPRFFTDFNHLRIQLIAHYALDHCEDPRHSSLWADISPATTLTLNIARVTLPDNQKSGNTTLLQESGFSACYRRRTTDVRPPWPVGRTAHPSMS